MSIEANDLAAKARWERHEVSTAMSKNDNSLTDTMGKKVSTQHAGEFVSIKGYVEARGI